GVLADVAVELGHEGLAEPHDLHVGATFGVEVRAALAPADRQAGEGVLEDLLETEELDRVQQNARVEAQASLVGAERRVELHPEAAVDLDLASVIDPGHPEDDLPLRLAQAGNDARLAVVGVLADHGSETVQHLEDGLVELGLAGVALKDLLIERLECGIESVHGDSLSEVGRSLRVYGRPHNHA